MSQLTISVRWEQQDNPTPENPNVFVIHVHASGVQGYSRSYRSIYGAHIAGEAAAAIMEYAKGKR